jgi:hypothetical protein
LIPPCGASLFRCSAAESEGLAGVWSFALLTQEHALWLRFASAKDARSTGLVQGGASGIVDYDYGAVKNFMKTYEKDKEAYNSVDASLVSHLVPKKGEVNL